MNSHRLRCLRLYFAIAFTILSAFALNGCGSGNPETKVSPTPNPLVAEYDVWVFGGAQGWVEFGPNTNYGWQTSTFFTSANLNPVLKILVAGMKPSSTYHMRAHVLRPDGRTWVDQDHTFTTGSMPPEYALGLKVTRPSQPSSPAASVREGVELLNLANTGSSTLQEAVMDLNGNIIWYYKPADGETVLPLKPLGNGHMIADVSRTSTGIYKLREIDLAGNTIRELSNTDLDQKLLALGRSVTLYQFHHDVLPLPNGHIILLANTQVPYDDLPGYPGTTKVTGDVLIDLDPNWNPVWFWSTFDHLDINRHLQGLPDWTHSNAVLYTANDGNLLLSIRHQSWVIKIDYANGQGTGDILWRLGEGGDFTLPSDDPSQWFYAQHYPNVLDINGSQLTMALIDNGNFRVLDGSGTECGATVPCYSRAVIFDVDEATHAANLAWQNIPGLYTNWGGSIGLADGGNVEFDLTAPFPSANPPYFLPMSRIQEVTQDSAQTVLWQADISGANAYRAYRIPSLYPGITWNQ